MTEDQVYIAMKAYQPDLHWMSTKLLNPVSLPPTAVDPEDVDRVRRLFMHAAREGLITSEEGKQCIIEIVLRHPLP